MKCTGCSSTSFFNAGGTVGTKRGEVGHTEIKTCEICGKSIEFIDIKVDKIYSLEGIEEARDRIDEHCSIHGIYQNVKNGLGDGAKTDIEKLKDVFDDIGLKYDDHFSYKSLEIETDSSYFKIYFNEKTGKYEDVQ